MIGSSNTHDDNVISQISSSIPRHPNKAKTISKRLTPRRFPRNSNYITEPKNFYSDSHIIKDTARRSKSKSSESTDLSNLIKNEKYLKENLGSNKSKSEHNALHNRDIKNVILSKGKKVNKTIKSALVKELASVKSISKMPERKSRYESPADPEGDTENLPPNNKTVLTSESNDNTSSGTKTKTPVAENQDPDPQKSQLLALLKQHHLKCLMEAQQETPLQDGE